MARTIDDIRREIEREREELVSAVGDLRRAVGVASRLRRKLPALAAGGAATGFALRAVARRGRGSTKTRTGRFRLVNRG